MCLHCAKNKSHNACVLCVRFIFKGFSTTCHPRADIMLTEFYFLKFLVILKLRDFNRNFLNCIKCYPRPVLLAVYQLQLENVLSVMLATYLQAISAAVLSRKYEYFFYSN